MFSAYSVLGLLALFALALALLGEDFTTGAALDLVAAGLDPFEGLEDFGFAAELLAVGFKVLRPSSVDGLGHWETKLLHNQSWLEQPSC